MHSDKGTNTCFVFDFPGARADYAETVAANPDAVVVRRRFRQQRLIPNPMEPRAVVVAPISAADEFTLYSTTQIPHILRVMLALTTGIPEHKLRVVAPDVGGGFGAKLNVYAEEVLALVVARKLGRPIKWTESRSENYQATTHGRDQIQDIEIAARPDGTLLGLKVELLADMGAYLQLITPGVPVLGAFMFPAIYKMDAYHFTCTGVFTTKTPTDAYRGAGRPEATYAIERIMDELAHELGRDPMELRQQNWIRHEEFPYEMVAGLTYDSGNYEAATAKAEQMFDMAGLRAEQEQRRAAKDPVQLGIGISTFTEMCGLAPSRVLGSLSYGAGGWESAQVRMLPTGKVEVVSGATPHGQGHHTAWSQIVADSLGVPFDDVELVAGDTRLQLEGDGHLRLAVAGGRRRRDPQGDREGDREGQADRGAPARGGRGRHLVLRRTVLRRRVAGRLADHPGGGAGDVRGAQPARRDGADAWTATTSTTRRTSPTRTAPTCAPWRSTPRRGSRRSASTSASTTSARS